LNEYFSLLTDITFRHEGTVFHMAGDCLMLGFGVPLEQPDSPERSVRAAQEMLRSFSGLARSWKERHDIDAGLGIGINEGDVVAGNVGSSSYMSYTIIGDTVNIAARLCQRARAGEILFSGSLKQSLDAHGMDVGATPLPPLQLRGRSHPIDIFCVPLETRMQVSDPRAARRLYVVIADSVHELERLTAELHFFANGALPLLRLPDWEVLPYELFSPHPDTISERLKTLFELPQLNDGCLIVSADTLMQR